MKIEDLNRTDLVDYLELARVALSDIEVSEYILNKCDISDEECLRLLNQLEKVLN